MPRRALSFALFSVSIGCIAEPPPTTLEVSDVQPREVDVGDRLEIRGAGFPLRRPAKIAFRGHVHRAGVAPEAINATIEVESRSEGRLEIPVDEAFAQRLTARGDTDHATFRGDVAVSFTAAEAGSAPLAGKASAVVIDVRVTRSKHANTDDAARAAVDLLGLEIANDVPASGGVVVSAVRSGSPAAGAGLLPGDVIVDFDGVRVASIADLIPAGDLAATIAVRREGSGELRTIAVPLDGVARRVPRGMIYGASLLAGVCLLLLLSMRRAPASAAVLERRIATRVRALRDRGAAPVTTVTRALVAALAGESSIRVSFGAVLFTFGCAALATVLPLLSPELDVVTLAMAAFTASAAIALVDGGVASRIARPHVAGALAVVTAVVTTGSFRVADLLRAQGALPWEWLSFRSPATLASMIVWAIAAATLAPRARASERAATYVTAALIAIFFLGGFRAPGVRAIEHETWSLAAIGAFVFVLKAWSAIAAIEVVRALLPMARSLPAARRAWIGIAVVAPALALLIGALPGGTGLSRALSAMTFGVSAVVVIFAAIRLYASVDRFGAGHLDPNA
jgi:NADH-quinone oxidoreductase subunit H